MDLQMQLVGVEPVVVEEDKSEAFVCVFRAVLSRDDVSKLPFNFLAGVRQ